MPPTTSDSYLDPALIAEVVRDVLARLEAGASPMTSPEEKNHTHPAAVSWSDRVITLETLSRCREGGSEILVDSRAVVTPAAKDEARRRGITIVRAANLPASQQSTPSPSLEITDTANPERADGVRRKLALRGVEFGSGLVVLSDQPAAEVHRRCVLGQRAVMIVAVDDVQRFAAELTPTAWVLDMQRMNLPTAVNAVAKIAQLGSC